MSNLDLTPKRTQLARKIVTVVDAFDWQQIKDADCDVVDIEFQTRESLDAAADLLMQLAALDPRLALRAQEKLEVVIKSISGLRVAKNPNRPSTQPVSGARGDPRAGRSPTHGADPGPVVVAETEAESVLQQVKAVGTDRLLSVPLESQPIEFYRVWKKVNELFQRLETLQSQGVRFTRVRRGQQTPTAPPVIVSEAAASTLPPSLPGKAVAAVPGTLSISEDLQVPPDSPVTPFNFGVAGLGAIIKLWLQVPLELALAPSIVGLCQRIASSNTGINELLVKPEEDLAIQLHLRLFSDCKPIRYQVATEELRHPYASVAHQHLNKFVKLLSKFLTAVGDSGRTEQPTNSETTAVVTTTVTHAVHPASDSAERTATASKPPNERQEKPKVKIWVGRDYKPRLLDGKIIGKKRVVLARALLGIAALGGDGATEVTFDTKSFIGLIYRTDKGVSKKWSDTWKQLDEEAHLQREGDNVRYRLWGFEVKLDQGVTKEMIREHLMSLPPRVN